MSDSVSALLDSIDGTLRDYGTSDDAMRWVPEGKRAECPAPAVGERIAVSIDWTPFVRAMEETVTGLARLFADLGTAVASGVAAFGRLAPVLEEAARARTREGSAMRSEYRRRSLARRRRRR